VYLTANKSNSLITFALGVPYERLIGWHKLWTILAIVVGCLHVCCAYRAGETGDEISIYGLYENQPDLIKFAFDGDHNTTGAVALLAMIGLFVFSAASIFRRLLFEFWYLPHVISAIVAGVCVSMHGAGGIIFVLVWWGVDIATRYALMAGILYPHQAAIRKLPGDIVEISFPKPASFEYEAGQYIMIAIPTLSVIQFHPFTMSSSPHQDTVTLHIKALGRWTRRLGDLADKGGPINILMEGPYGKLMIDLDDVERYKMVLMISGGIGVTPMQSIANGLLHEMEDQGRDIKKLRFVWTVRSRDMIRAMRDNGDRDSLEGTTIYDNKLTSDAVDVNIYLTRKGPDEETEELSAVKDGRPDFDVIFQEMKQAAIDENETVVAVCVCGPTPMVDACRAASRKWSDGLCKGGVKFDFHEETFEL